MLKALLKFPPDILYYILDFVGTENQVVCFIDKKIVVIKKK